jgi:N-acetylglutamate synthase-like GNAT family acetyltransferase
LSKETVTLYEDVQEFWVVDDQEHGGVIDCGPLHVMWEYLAEVRTLATDHVGLVEATEPRCCRNCCPWHANWA